MSEIMATLEKIMDMGKSTSQEQKEINVLEVGHLWNDLVARYKVIQETQILNNFCQDTDLTKIIDIGLQVMTKQVEVLENWLEHYGVPLPKKPPATSKANVNVEVITDQYVFRQIFAGIQQFLDVHMKAFMQTSSPKLREQFKEFLLQEIELYDKFFEYGKFKEWTIGPPSYRA